MKKLFLTTALVFPLALGPALAQQATVPPPEQSTEAGTQADAQPGADATTDAATDMDTGTAPDAADAAADTIPATGDAATDASQAAADGAQDAADTASEAAGDTSAAASDAADDAAAAADAAADAAAEADAAAADAATEAAADAGAVVSDPDKVVREQAINELRLDWVTGASVTAPDGETIGKVSDLILDRDSGQMVAAVIGVGGFLGIGEKKIAVPWERLTIDFDAYQISSDLSREEAEAAPEYVFRQRETMPAPEPMATDAPPIAPVPVE